jgi:hypothetical protein
MKEGATTSYVTCGTGVLDYSKMRTRSQGLVKGRAKHGLVTCVARGG